ncbi:hypothetical protein HanXRQr2_Chr02g0051441 [Helianthus annuus]|uniref:Uncharacterized protein n=1 Tax=Helianthus annuus TaxID=4232 RepID=A0A9K3JMQ2_HELAN|nr:hypothetical protein HanXRQr2_Chr02g0051441 [Helianthus annuus]
MHANKFTFLETTSRNHAKLALHRNVQLLQRDWVVLRTNNETTQWVYVPLFLLKYILTRV